MKLKSLIAATVLGAASIGSACAAAYSIDLNNTGTNVWTASYGATPVIGDFTDTFTFSPSATAGSFVQTFLANVSYTGADNMAVTFSSVSLNSIALTDVSTSTPFGAFHGALLAPTEILIGAPLVLTVMGNSKGGSYAGDFNLTLAPVPEPETYAMMLAGLGILGFLARRRKQS